MEIEEEKFQALATYIERASINPSLECEAVLKYPELTSLDFDFLYNYFKNSKNFRLVDEDKQDALDVSFNYKSKNTRVSIYKNSNIKQFCTDSKLSTDVHVIQKEPYKPIDMNDMYFQINLKEEKQLMNESEFDMDDLKSKFSTTKKFFRQKKRFSFIHNSSLRDFRIDLTIVKESLDDNSIDYNTTKFKNSYKYEVEIEYLHDKNTVKNTETVAKGFLKLIIKILKLVFRTEKVLLKTTQNDLKKKYSSLLNGKVEFLSYKPVTLELQHLNSEDEFKNISILKTNIKQDEEETLEYAVTEKADGERMLLFIDKGNIYTLNNNLLFTYVSFCEYLKKIEGSSLIDGELITYKGGAKEFAAFDIYFLGGDDTRDLIFMKRDEKQNKTDKEGKSTSKNKANKDYTRLQKLKRIIQKIENSNKKEYIKKFTTKTFKIAENGVTILDQAAKILNHIHEYKIDGLIFQPMNLCVGAKDLNSRKGQPGTWYRVYKWKPAHESTIDFLIRFEIEPYSKNEGEVDAGLFVANSEEIVSKPVDFLLEKSKKMYPKYNKLSEYKFGECKLKIKDGNCFSIYNKNINNTVTQIKNNTIIECSFDTTTKTWVPKQVRTDKTSKYEQSGYNIQGTANFITVAESVLQSINYPVKEEMITGGVKVCNENLPPREDKYSLRDKGFLRDQSLLKPMLDFHNKFVKGELLIDEFKLHCETCFDYGCGKGGDINKYEHGRKFENGKKIQSKLNFVLGADVSLDSILTANDSAWNRYINLTRKQKKTQTKKNVDMIFVQMDGSREWNPDYFRETTFDENLGELTKTLWGKQQKIEKGLQKFNGKATKGFDLVSCQFALHYFFKNKDTLNNFCKNLNKLMKPGSYFIGTCLDGKRVKEKLKDRVSIQGKSNDMVMWNITKRYEENQTNILGEKVDVYMESINQVITEYLVDFEELIKKLGEFEIKPLELKEQEVVNLEKFGSYGSFEKLYNAYLNKNKENKDTEMSLELKNYSFLNNFFVFKKHADV